MIKLLLVYFIGAGFSEYFETEYPVKAIFFYKAYSSDYTYRQKADIRKGTLLRSPEGYENHVRIRANGLTHFVLKSDYLRVDNDLE